MTVYDFIQAHKKGNYILSIPNHYCSVVDGKIRDTWNTSDKIVYGYFDMKNFKIK